MMKKIFSAALIASPFILSVSASNASQVNAEELVLKEIATCEEESKALNMRIVAFNEKVSAYKAEQEAEVTGTRIDGSGDGVVIVSLYLSEGEGHRLYEEGAALNEERTAHWERCQKFAAVGE